MTYHYGFELEGFAIDMKTGDISLPPADWPTDGFPGLLELRSSGGKRAENAYYELLKEYMWLSRKTHLPTFRICEHKFNGKEIAQLRRTAVFHKEMIDIRNVYGKEPRSLNGRTLAAFQINVSHLASQTHDTVVDGKIVSGKKHYGIFDITGVVKRLDEVFKHEIKEAKRQPGMYAIKDDCRLEYRSLPNFVFEDDVLQASLLIDKIKKAVEG